MSQTRRVAILGGCRTPFARSGTAYKDLSNQDLLTTTLKGIVEEFSLQGEQLGDVGLGAVIKHAQDFNLARESVLGSGLHPTTPAFDLQRACGTSLETAIQIANKIALGQIEVGIAGGSDTNSDVPMEFSKKFTSRLVKSSRAKTIADKAKLWLGVNPLELKPVLPAVVEARTHLSMGQHCEKMAKEWQIARADQDQLAFESHQKGVKAYEEGFYDDLVVECHGLSKDNNLRADTSIEKLAKLKPVFDRSEKGTLTAGNSTPLTDGASGVLLASEEWAKRKGIPIQAYIVHGKVAAVDFVGGEGLLMAPTVAVAELLKDLELKLQDFDTYELHEAFAAQLLCTLAAWESDNYCQKRLGQPALGAIDRGKLNLKGGSVGVGHPFAATGSRLIATMGKMFKDQKGQRGLISACTAGGMGVAMVLESP